MKETIMFNAGSEDEIGIIVGDKLIVEITCMQDKINQVKSFVVELNKIVTEMEELKEE